MSEKHSISPSPESPSDGFQVCQRIEYTGLLGHMATLPDGRMLSMYTSRRPPETMEEVGPEQPAWIRTSSDNGLTWTEPEKAFSYPAGKGNVGSLYPLVDQQGNIHVFALRLFRLRRGKAMGRIELRHNVSRDGGKTWTVPKRVDFGHDYTGALNSVIQLKTGRLLTALSYNTDEFTNREQYDNNCVSVYSDDLGETWQIGSDDISVPAGEFEGHPGALEPVIVELSDGRVWMIIRTQQRRFYEAFSKDGGKTWTAAKPTSLQAPNAPAAVCKLADGRLFLCWNDLSRYPAGQIVRNGRQHLHAAISDDDGETFRPSQLIATRQEGEDPDTQLAYPFLCETADNHVVVLYYRVGHKPGATWWTPEIEVLRVDPR